MEHSLTDSRFGETLHIYFLRDNQDRALSQYLIRKLYLNRDEDNLKAVWSGLWSDGNCDTFEDSSENSHIMEDMCESVLRTNIETEGQTYLLVTLANLTDL